MPCYKQMAENIQYTMAAFNCILRKYLAFWLKDVKVVWTHFESKVIISLEQFLQAGSYD